jgi:hypothetical protein
VTTFTHDERGRRTSRTLPLGQQQYPGQFVETWAYDEYGRTERHIDFEGQVTVYAYDGRGRVETKSFFDSLADEMANNPADTVTYAYDQYIAEGRRETTDDTRNPGTNERIYDREGRLTRLTIPQGTIRYEYDPSTGQKVGMSTGDPLAPTTEIAYAYDPLGRLEAVHALRLNDTDVPAIERTTAYTYDAAGNLVVTARPNGTFETRTYDDLGRLSRSSQRF